VISSSLWYKHPLLVTNTLTKLYCRTAATFFAPNSQCNKKQKCGVNVQISAATQIQCWHCLVLCGNGTKWSLLWCLHVSSINQNMQMSPKIWNLKKCSYIAHERWQFQHQSIFISCRKNGIIIIKIISVKPISVFTKGG
jgi:hypothetical protein